MKKLLLGVICLVMIQATSYSQNLPEGVYRVCLSPDPMPNSAAGVKKTFWKNGSVIKVGFLGYRIPYLESKVIQYANVWTQYANIKFQFIDNVYAADIKIEFSNDGSSWSMIGTDCIQSRPNEATMHYGWFNQSTPEEEFSRTIIHEFGHALGLIHEHQNPGADIKWDKPAVYQYYARQGWNEQMVDFNLFQKYDYTFVNATQYDPQSIMHYPIDSRLTLDGYSVGWNTSLSELDKIFISKTYPKLFSSSVAPNSFQVENACYFYSTAPIEPLVLLDPPSKEYEQLVNEISNALGLASNKFTIKIGNIPNACAVFNKSDKKRYIIFSQNFFENLTAQKSTSSIWIARAILAHELAHHLNGDTFEETSDRQSIELKADEFIGSTLFKLKCPDLKTAQLAINSIALDRELSNYPPRSARIESIAIGWRKAANETYLVNEKSAALKLNTLLSPSKFGSPYKLEITIEASDEELSNILTVTYEVPDIRKTQWGFRKYIYLMDNFQNKFYLSLGVTKPFMVIAKVKYKDGTTKDLKKSFQITNN